MTFELGAFIIIAVSFIYSLAAGYIKNNNLRQASYIWFPFVASIALYWIPNIDQIIHPEKYEGGWAWFSIIYWTLPGLIASLSALFLKWLIRKFNRKNESI